MKVNVPKDFLLGPIFTATPQKGPRSLTVGTRQYQIGGFHPLDPLKKPPGLDVRHARALFTLLSFRSIVPGSPLVRFSMREFSQRWCRSYGGVHARSLRVLMGDLLDTYLRVHDRATGRTHTYRLIERIDIEHRPFRGRLRSRGEQQDLEAARTDAVWFDSITLSPEFVDLLDRSGSVQSFDLEGLTQMRSRLAQSVYLHLPSRAYHHTPENPFSITLTRLLEQVSHPYGQKTHAACL